MLFEGEYDSGDIWYYFLCVCLIFKHTHIVFLFSLQIYHGDQIPYTTAVIDTSVKLQAISVLTIN